MIVTWRNSRLMCIGRLRRGWLANGKSAPRRLSG
jgi:hypothetical protein